MNNEYKYCERRTQIIRYLVEYKANINFKGSDGLTPLMLAVKSQDAQLVKCFLDRGADPHALSIDNNYSLWHIFANSDGKFNKTETASIAQQLMLAKADINQTDKQGNTPLHLEIERNNGLSLIEISIANGARTNRRNNQGETPLMIAISKNYFDAVNQIVSILGNSYQIVDLLGEGGSGKTYRALDDRSQTEVAIKVLSLRGMGDWKTLELFEREAKILARLTHSAIPRYLSTRNRNSRSTGNLSDETRQYYHLQTDKVGKYRKCTLPNSR